MSHSNYLPDSISYKKLLKLISAANKESELEQKNYPNSEFNDFNESLSKWADISKEVLDRLESNQINIIRNRSSHSSMALGALKAHLIMAFTAYKEIEKID